MSNYTPEGYAAAQGGPFEFRYVFSTGGAFDPGRAARFGGEAQTPLETGEITRADKIDPRGGSWDPVSAPGLEVEPEEVHVSAWKQAEDGRGMILRLVETGGRAREARLRIPASRLGRATRCTAVEDDLDALEVVDGRVRVSIPAYGLATVRWEAVSQERAAEPARLERE